MLKKCTLLHISTTKVLNTDSLRPLLDVEMSKKFTRLWGEAHLEVKMVKTHHVRTTFGRSSVVFRGRICKHAVHVARAVQETYEAVIFWRSGSRFPEGCLLEHQIIRFAKMILCHRCGTSLFCGRRSTLERWDRKIELL